MSESVERASGASGRRVVIGMLVAVAVVAVIGFVGMLVAVATNGPDHRPAPAVTRSASRLPTARLT